MDRYYRCHAHAVINNGVDVDLFRPRDRLEARARFRLPEQAKLALFVGRLEARKGSDLLDSACRQAGWQLFVAGRDEPVGGHHLGVLKPEELAWAYSAADCVLLPTRYEGCGFVGLEAVAAGIPLLTTRTGWTPSLLEAVPEYRVFTVWPEVNDLVARLRTLHEVDHSPVVAAARHHVCTHNSLTVFASAWSSLIERVAESGALRGGETGHQEGARR